MSRRLISVAVAVVVATGLALAAACSDSSSAGDGGASSSSGGSGSGGGSGSDSGSGSGSGSGGGSDSGSGSDAGTSSESGDGSSSSSGGGPDDASVFAPSCTASAAGLTQIDNESKASTQITFTPTFSPASCGTPGAWFSFPAGATTTPSNPFTFSPIPAGIPAEAGVMEPNATVADAATGDGGGSVEGGGDDGGGSVEGGDGEGGMSGPMAACLSGVTGATAYSTSGMGFNFGTTALSVTVDASSHTGVQFWIWGGSAADGGTQTLSVVLPDINQTGGFGPAGMKTATGQLCDPTATGGGTACGAARAFITVQPGWQLLALPFTSFAEMAGYSSSNELTLDTTTLTGIAWWSQAPGMPDGGVSYDFCVYGVSFY